MKLTGVIARLREGDPLVSLSLIHAEQAALCDELEHIADSLPQCADRSALVRIAERLIPLVHEVHQFEEEIIFPLFEEKLRERVELPTMIKRLKAEHDDDEYFAEEVADALRKVGEGETIRNPEAFGYMLRAFFESMRRQIAFEREQMLALALKWN